MSQHSHNLRAQDCHLDPPDLGEVDDDDDMLSDCCGARAENEIDEDSMAVCNNCKEWATFSGLDGLPINSVGVTNASTT